MFEYLFKFDNSDLFKEKWNHFLCQQPASIKYTELYLEYSLALSESVEDYSFVMLLNEEVVGIAFLPIETLQSGAKWISLSENYIIAPLASNPKATGAIFKKIDLQYALDENFEVFSRLGIFKNYMSGLGKKTLLQSVRFSTRAVVN